MYKTVLFFKIKDTAALEKHRILEIFFKSWIDEVCNNEVKYTLEGVKELPTSNCWEEIYRVDFENFEDALALKLSGVPKEFRNYIELVP